MEALVIIGFMFGLRALQENEAFKDTIEVKERWKREQCSRNIHFDYLGYCSACGKKLRDI